MLILKNEEWLISIENLYFYRKTVSENMTDSCLEGISLFLFSERSVHSRILRICDAASSVPLKWSETRGGTSFQRAMFCEERS